MAGADRFAGRAAPAVEGAGTKPNQPAQEAKLWVCRDVLGTDPRQAVWGAERQARTWEEAKAVGCGRMDWSYDDGWMDWYFILPVQEMKTLLARLAGEGYGPFTLDAEDAGVVEELEALGPDVVAVVEQLPLS